MLLANILKHGFALYKKYVIYKKDMPNPPFIMSKEFLALISVSIQKIKGFTLKVLTLPITHTMVHYYSVQNASSIIKSFCQPIALC